VFAAAAASVLPDDDDDDDEALEAVADAPDTVVDMLDARLEVELEAGAVPVLDAVEAQVAEVGRFVTPATRQRSWAYFIVPARARSSEDKARNS
jgi:hypothetical protein